MEGRIKFLKRSRLMICGEGRHGKDTVAELLEKTLGLTFVSSSQFVSEEVIFPVLKDVYGYQTHQECFNDRMNHRDEWFQLITEYNTPNKTQLAEDLYSKYNTYVGIRNKQEFESVLQSPLSPHLIIWVDASRRRENKEGLSNEITPEMCDITIDNNGSLQELKRKVERLSTLLHSEFNQKRLF